MRMCWVTVNVKNMEESVAFWQDIVGLKIDRRMNPMPGTELVFFGTGGGTEVELIANAKNPNPQYGKDMSVGFETASLDALIAKLKEKGVAMQGPFQPNPAVRFVYIEDPNGVRIQFVENAR